MSGRLAIQGLGLIGGSFALGARRAQLYDEIVGVDLSAAHGKRALELGLCDRLEDEVPADADAVLLAVPSDRIPAALAGLKDHQGLVFDVASVKAGILARATARPRRFVPAHPIAGSERSGPEAARADLFADHLVILTPDGEGDSAAAADREQVELWWQALGARVQIMSPAAHDQLFARTSHLPHLVAFAYMQLIESDQLPYAAGGFRDFSRIAGGDPTMWAPIFRLNQKAVLKELAALRKALSALEQAISDDATIGTLDPLVELLTASQRRRRDFESSR